MWPAGAVPGRMGDLGGVSTPLGRRCCPQGLRCLNPGGDPLGFLAILGMSLFPHIMDSVSSLPQGESCSLPVLAGPSSSHWRRTYF